MAILDSIPECCKEVTRVSLPSCQEKGNRFQIKNPNREEVTVVALDQCEDPKRRGRKRCDYLFVTSSRVEAFVELKGSDVEKALEQLDETLTDLGGSAGDSPTLYAVVVFKSFGTEKPRLLKWMSRLGKFRAKVILAKQSCRLDPESGSYSSC